MIQFLKQLWPWTRQRQFLATFIAETNPSKQNSDMRTTDVISTQSLGDLVMVTHGQVDATNLREAARVEITKKLEESGHEVKTMTLWISRLA